LTIRPRFSQVLVERDVALARSGECADLLDRLLKVRTVAEQQTAGQSNISFN